MSLTSTLFTAAALGFGLLGALTPAFAQPIEVGAPAPAATVTVDTGATVALADVYAKGPVLVYFYPKSFTGGCTAQACNLRDAFAELTTAGLQVLAVSGDDVATQARFRAEHELPFPVVADTTGALAGAFGVPFNNGFAARQSFLVLDGKIVWRNLRSDPRTQAQDALAALRAAQ